MKDFAASAPDLNDYVALFVRRRRVLLTIGSLVLITSIVIAVALPTLYRSTGIILIEQPEIPEDMIRSTIITQEANLDIQRTSDRVLRTENLIPIVERHNLYPEDRESTSLESLARQLRSNVEITPLRETDMPTGSEGNDTIAFEVSFFSPEPVAARSVAVDLVDLYLAENQRTRSEAVLQTVRFLSMEAEKISERIQETEVALAAFKQRNSGQLPEQIDMNLQVMERTERELIQVEDDIRTLQQQRSRLRTELSQLSPTAPIYTEEGKPILGTDDRLKLLEREFVRLAALYGPEHPDRIRVQREIDMITDGKPSGQRGYALREELRAREADLAELQKQYSYDHPDVLRMTKLVGELREQIQNTQGTSAAYTSTPQAVPDNPQYINIVLELESVGEELLARKNRQYKLRAKLADLEQKIITTPQVEKEYRNLSRDYENAVAKYNEIRNKQTKAELAVSLESEQYAEKYVVYRRPDLPRKPAEPNRPLILALGGFLAISLSIGLVVLVDALDTSVRSRRDITAILEGPPIASIPFIPNRSDIFGRAIKGIGLVLSMGLWSGLLFITIQLLN